MKQLLIYIPGLGGDGTLSRQEHIVKRWGDKKVKSLFINPRWQSNEPFLDKLQRLIGEVEKLNLDQYQSITIIGTSAGGSMGMNLFNNFKDNDKFKLISVCGKLRNVENIGWQYRSKNPALIESVLASEKAAHMFSSQEKQRIISVVPLFDEVVRKPCMYFNGITIKRQYTLGHVISIAYAIIFKVNKFKKFYS